MKYNFIILLVIFGLSQIQCSVRHNIVSYGKFKIYKNQGILHCGSLECPDATRCIITQRNDRNDTSKIITREKCFNDDDELVNSSEVIEDANVNQNNINLRIESGHNGNSIVRSRSDDENKKYMEERSLRLRNHLEDIRLRNEERQRRLEDQRIEREERLAADAHRRREDALERKENLRRDMEELHSRLERDRIERLEQYRQNFNDRFNFEV